MDLISSVTSSLGIDASSAQGAVGSVLKLIKQQAPADAFSEVEKKVPEASSWMGAAPPEDAGGGLGGMLGAAAGALGGSLGGSLGSALGGAGPLAGLVSQLSKSGLGGDALGKLVPLVLQFLQSRVGDGVVAKLLAAAPALSSLVGGGSAGAAGGGENPLGKLGGLFK